MAVADYVVLDPAVLEQPYDYYAALRGEAPVHQTPFGFWLVSRYDDVMSIVRDPARFGSEAAFGAMAGGEPSEELKAIAAQGFAPANTLLTNDPPSHTRFRGLVNQAFSPKRVAQMEGDIAVIAQQLAAGFADKGRVELSSQFAVPLPLTVIADALGVSRDDMGDFKRWSDDSVAPLSGLLTPERQLGCARSRVAFQHYMAARIEERRAERRDDLLSDLVHASMADEDGTERGLTVPELLNVIEQLLVAGNETTTKLINAGMLLLVQHPGQLAALRADRSLVPNLVEEALRFESPVQMLPRVAKVDVELGGVAVPAGSLLFVVYGSANRDDGHFPDASAFDVRRPNARSHLAFGQGPHFCVGAALARAEGRIAFETLLDLDGWALAGPPPERELSMVLRGLSRLELTFTPEGPRA